MKSRLHIRLLACVAIGAIAVQLSAVPLSILLFRLNQAEISRTVCEHKMPHCNGHCYLMKQLAKSTNAASDKQTSRFEIHLDGQFLTAVEENLTLRTSDSRLLYGSACHEISGGWQLNVLEPPRA